MWLNTFMSQRFIQEIVKCSVFLTFGVPAKPVGEAIFLYNEKNNQIYFVLIVACTIFALYLVQQINLSRKQVTKYMKWLNGFMTDYLYITKIILIIYYAYTE